MSSYLPENTYIVCTFQTGNDYKELLIDSDMREISVFYKEKRGFLTIVDKKLNDDFTCKTGWSKGLSVAAFGGGMGVGIGTGIAAAAPVIATMLGSAAVASAVPVIGWVVGGIIALAAIGYALYSIFSNPKCSGALGNETSQWKLYHPKVYFNKRNAILGSSILQCGEGGILLPFISETAASKAASTIGWNNKIDIGTNILANALAGYSLGRGGIQALLNPASLEIFVMSTYIGIEFGDRVINPSAQYVGDKWGDHFGDERYDEIQQSTGNNPEKDRDLLDYIMGASNPAEDSMGIWGSRTEILNNMKANGASKEAIAAFESAIRAANSNGGSFANPESQQILSDIQQGKYGQKAADIFRNANGNARGMHTEGNYNEATNSSKKDITANRWKTLKEAGKLAATLFCIAQPFISSIFNKHTLIKAIEIQEEANAEDGSNSISVVSKDY